VVDYFEEGIAAKKDIKDGATPTFEGLRERGGNAGRRVFDG
jgi:hypothetical protein